MPNDPKAETGTLHTDQGDVPLETSGPYREELGQEINAQTLTGDASTGEGAATTPRRDGTNGEKESPDTTGTNPKRKENSRPN